MWAKALDIFSKYLLVPLLTKGAAYIKDLVLRWVKANNERKRKKAAAKANKIKVKKYENSETRTDNSDNFRDLP